MKFEIRNSIPQARDETNSKTETQAPERGVHAASAWNFQGWSNFKGTQYLVRNLKRRERRAPMPGLKRVRGLSHSTLNTQHAFTLIELLVVIAIIGILAAIAMPTIGMFKPNPLAAASRQLLDDLSYARHKALADHTTVYMVFMPAEVNLEQNTLQWNNVNPAGGGINPVVRERMLRAQYNGYALYERRQIGDQPGQKRAHWLTNWRLLPKGTFIAPQKFGRNVVAPLQQKLTDAFPANNYGAFNFLTFNYGNSTDPNADDGPFYTDPENWRYTNSYSRMPFIAFDYRGSLVGPWNGWQGPYIPDARGVITNHPVADCVIPLTQGIVYTSTNINTPGFPKPTENPPNSWTNVPGYNLVVVDGTTGRARIERVQVQ